jgi:hypothetical protein
MKNKFVRIVDKPKYQSIVARILQKKEAQQKLASNINSTKTKGGNA